jgi:UDP-N-acetylmuramyl pentapeptide phosphotransferase/UDP-N-acetylglucosamine-1-phosphate transferase
MISTAARVLIPSATSFALGIAFAPLLAGILYRAKAWKKSAGKGNGIGGGGTPIFDELHKEREVSTPRMGGILIWASVLMTALFFWILAHSLDTFWSALDFVNRRETWLPLFALAAGAFAGLVDDFLEITEGKGGLSLARRISIVGSIGLAAGWWFYAKLGVTAIGIPFSAPFTLGWLVVPFFALVTLAIYAGGTIDGLDGLAGGVFAIMFMAYAGIAFGEGQTSLAAFAASVAGATLAFLWFNVPPARFYMSETGSMALTLALSMTAFASDTLGGGVGVFVLPLVAFPLTATVLTTLLQVFWKKVFHKKLFRVAPVHHHFEALGWPAAKVTMRYWIITIIAGVLGLSIALLARMP